MSVSVPPSIIRKTQDSLGRYVKKPPLSDKLLNKPPFRFLHDVISAVIRDRGVFSGLYTDEEMNSSNVKDKDSKIRYLEKIISAVTFASGVNVQAKPGKIISGQDASKTNEFLQLLALVIIKKIDTSEAVRKTLSGEKPGVAKVKQRSAGKVQESSSKRRGSKTSSSGSELNGREDSGGSSRKSSSKKREEDIILVTSNNGINNESLTKQQSENEGDRKQEDANEELKETQIINTLSTVPEEEHSILGEDTDESEKPIHSDEMTVQSTAEQPLPSSSTPTTTDIVPQRPGSSIKSARPRTGRLKSAARPPSARPAAPRLREKQESVEEEIITRPGTSKAVNVIVDAGIDDDDDDEDNFLVQETVQKDILSIEAGILKNEISIAETDAIVESGGQEHGGLVQEILETQKEYVTAEEKQKPTVEIERDIGLTDLSRRRERESTQREIDRLRESIQTLTRYANPLGKLMDFLQEDVDSMQRELDTWKEEKRKLKVQLNHEEFLTQKSIEPLKDHLYELERNVEEQLDKISSIKSTVLKNDEKMAKMISNIGIVNK